MQAKKTTLSCWGNHQRSDCSVFRPERVEELQALIQQKHTGGILPYANGLNYGDQAFNTGGYIIQTIRLDRLLSFDKETGVLVCEPGVTFRDLLITFLPKGWAPPVIPGTLNVTMGGAVANDVHGKNDHGYGSFGRHVLSLDVVTPAGIQTLSPHENAELFYATIGGLGLTGVICKITLQMSQVTSDTLKVKSCRVEGLETWLDILNVSEKSGFSAGWMDLSPKGISSARGLFWKADFLTASEEKKHANLRQYPPLPFLPFMQYTNVLKWLNLVYFHRVPKKGRTQYQHLMDFINPLDKIKSWNRWYGRAGLYQLQFLLPQKAALSGLQTVMRCIQDHHAQPGLAVIKKLSQEGVGLLSFTSPGVTLALDFHNTPSHKKAIQEITAIVQAHHGKVYLAKDALMDKLTFQKMYPGQETFRKIREQYGLKDVFNSDLSRRLGI